jgi:Flp pilus assembly pilin Flp
MVEYALLIGLISLVCVAAMSVFGNRISNVFASFSNSI